MWGFHWPCGKFNILRSKESPINYVRWVWKAFLVNFIFFEGLLKYTFTSQIMHAPQKIYTQAIIKSKASQNSITYEISSKETDKQKFLQKLELDSNVHMSKWFTNQITNSIPIRKFLQENFIKEEKHL